MKNLNREFDWLKANKIWVFPVVCIVIFSVLCLARIHGSSLGYFRTATNPGTKDPSLLFGTPRSIRSDEWVVTTPYVYSQKTENYPVINKTVGNGQDMAVVLDVPYRDWSTFFRPQNIAFFIVPFSMAFSARWWLPLLILLIGTYLLIREFLPPPKRNLLSGILATSFSLSPFIMWWFTSGTLLSIGYVFVLIYLAIKLLDCRNLVYKFILSLLIAYFGVCLAITMYIPFMVASCFAGVFIFIAYLISQKEYKQLLKKENIICLLGAVGIATLIVLTFYFAHRDTIKLIQDTIYPGHLSAENTPLRVQTFLNVFALSFLQSSQYVIKYSNQSEFSNFIYLFPYLAFPTGYSIYRGMVTKKNDWLLIIVSLGICVVLMRMFLPFNTDPLFRFVLLNRVPNGRLLIGLGMLNIIFLVAWLRNIILQKKSLPKSIKIITSFITAIILLTQYYFFKTEYNFVSRYTKPYIIFLFIALLVTTVFFLQKKTIIYGGIVLFVVSLSMAFYINPVYKGVIFQKDIIIDKITEINNQQNGTWVVVNNLVLEHYPQMAGVRSMSGVMTYPQYDVWNNFPNVDQYQRVINRYAHIRFQLNSQNIDTMIKFQPDLYDVNIDPCDSFAQKSITYFLSISPETSKCLEKLDNFNFNQQPIFIYKVRQIMI